MRKEGKMQEEVGKGGKADGHRRVGERQKVKEMTQKSR